MTSVAIVIALVLGGFVLALPRRFAALPLLLAGCYVTLGPRVVVLGLDFTVFRLLVLIGWLRIVSRHEIQGFRPHPLDKLIVAWVVVSIITGTMLEQSLSGLIFGFGLGYNAIGLYFLFRILIRSADELTATLRMLAFSIVPLAVLMLVNRHTGSNPFAVLGGVPEIGIIRDGRLRCQGPFAHPILAGTFGATLTPMMVALFAQGQAFRRAAVIGLVAASIIVYASSSSGPLMAYLAGMIGLGFWRVRERMRSVRWMLLLALITLEIVMKSHVWFLFGRLSNVIGGDGWQRAELIDSAIRHFPDWWFCGSLHTEHWIEFGTSNVEYSADITSQYIFEAVTGGLARISLFVAVVVGGFRAAGRVRSRVEAEQRGTAVLAWCFGAALLAHVSSFLSVAYFDQMVVFWQFLLAALATIDATTAPPSPRETSHAVKLSAATS